MITSISLILHCLLIEAADPQNLSIEAAVSGRARARLSAAVMSYLVFDGALSKNFHSTLHCSIVHGYYYYFYQYSCHFFNSILLCTVLITSFSPKFSLLVVEAVRVTTA